jgi:hypothetical protein
MTWIVTLYKEGGEHDGETFACGPFADRDEAGSAAAHLADYGTTDVLPLAPTVVEIEHVL